MEKPYYTIVITEHDRVIRIVNGSWERSGGPDTEPEYDYAPDREQLVNTDTEVLKQSVKELDLAAVIKAVNGL